MYGVGFEPTKLSHDILSVTPLTARETIQIEKVVLLYIDIGTCLSSFQILYPLMVSPPISPRVGFEPTTCRLTADRSAY